MSFLSRDKAMHRKNKSGREIELQVLGFAALMFFNAPAQAAESDIAYAAPVSGAYQEFDLGASSLSAASANYSQSVESGVSGGVGTSGTGGTYGNASGPTRRPAHGAPRTTGTQGVVMAPARTAILDRTFGRLMFLPPTSTDSFVRNSAGNADLIYGDEGYDGPPPFYGFDESHRIERGIYNPGLTTGHRSALPDAWGYPN